MHLSREAVNRFEQVHLLVIHEEESDWESEFEYAQEVGIDLIAEKKQELAQMRDAVLNVVPARFHAAVLDDSIYLPGVDPALRDDYLQWQKAASEEFEKILEGAANNKEKTLPYLQEKAREVFSESLHDAQVFKVEEHGQDRRVYFDTTGGFTTKAVVILKFIGVTKLEGQWEENLWYVYDELEKVASGVAFKLITNWPEEIYLECETINAAYYYYPKAHYEVDHAVSWAEYSSMLNEEARYFWIDANGVEEVSYNHLKEVDGQVVLDGRVLADTVEEAIQHLYTDIYEDPYAHFSEPVPADEIMDAVLSEDTELRIRAWNTMYAQAKELAPIINNLLARLTVSDEDEMMLYVFVRHFNSEGILSEDNQAKYRAVLEEE